MALRLAVIGWLFATLVFTTSSHGQFFTESFSATDGAFPNPNTNYPANPGAEPGVWGLQVEVQDSTPQGLVRGMTFWGPYYPVPGEQFPPTVDPIANNLATFYNQIDTQWFFFRVGGQLQEFPLDQLGLNPPWSPPNLFPNNPIALHYGSPNDPFQVDVTYTLSATSIASSSIHESVTLTNNLPIPLDLDWFELTDFSLDGQNINLGTRTGGFSNYTQGGLLPTTLATVDVVNGPTPDRWEINDSGVIEASLRDGGITTLSNSDNIVGLFPNPSQAFEWNLTLPPSGSVTIEKVKAGNFTPIVLPDPANSNSFVFHDGSPVSGQITLGNPPRWYDPPVTTGYVFDVSNGPNFQNFQSPPILSPGQTLSLKITDPTHPDAGQVISVGTAPFDFGLAGAKSFEVFGISPREGIDPKDFTAYPAGLTFVTSSPVTFSQTPIVVDGDFNMNGVLDIGDINALAAAVNVGTDLSFDLDNDDNLTQLDIQVWVQDMFITWLGDVNLDGRFDTTDLVDVLQAGKFETGQPATYEEGDWNGDGQFTTSDLIKSLQDGGFEVGPRPIAIVPEPSSFGIVAVLTLPLLPRTRSTRHGVNQ